MKGLLGTLRVRLTAESEDFRKGLSSARQQLGSFSKDIDKFRTNTLANVASIGAFAAVLKSSLDVANQYDNAQRQLAATAKLTGIEFGTLQGISQRAQSQFRLSAIAANAFTVELSKLASKAGDVGNASVGLEAFLDIGAARGLSADQTLKAVQQSILGIDEGTDKLFSKNPSVLYAEFAASIGTTAGRLTDQQKAQALLNAAMQDGSKVRGEYGKWLESSAGQQYLLSQSIEQTQAALGKALQPALVAILPLITQMANGVLLAIQGWQMLGAKLATIPPLFRMLGAALTFNKDAFEQARRDYKLLIEAADEVIAGIKRISTTPPPTLPLPTTTQVQQAGKSAAFAYFDGLKTEWENLRHSVALRALGPDATEAQRLALEEDHALRLLAIEKERLQARFRAKDITKQDLDQQLKELSIRGEIAKTRTKEFLEVDRALEKQQNVSDLVTSITDLVPSGKSSKGNEIGSKAAQVLADKYDIGGILGLALPGIGGLVGGGIGSLVSSIFGAEKKQDKQVAALERIEANTRDTAHILELERRALAVARGAVNVPSRFTLPQFSTSATINQTINVTVEAGGDATEVVKVVQRELGPMLRREFHAMGFAR